MNKSLVSSLLLIVIGASFVASQNVISSLSSNYTVAAKFMPDLGMLFYDKLDMSGHIVERIEKFFPVPPVSQCNSTTYGDLQASL